MSENFIERKEENLSIQIFAVSAAMVGVCLTVIGLIAISSALRKIETVGDELVAIDGILFLISCIVSYMGIRKKSKEQRLKIEKVADLFFLSALSLVAVICVLIVLQFI